MLLFILQGKRLSPTLWVSWRTTLTALLTIWLLAGFGCAQSPPDAGEQPATYTATATESQSEYEQETIAESTQEAYEEEEEVLLVRYYPPPRELPKAQIVSSGSVISVVEGAVLSAKWNFDSSIPALVGDVPNPYIWPEATVIDSSNSVVRFLTDVEPGLVFVEGYPGLNPDGSGIPIGAEIDRSGHYVEYECALGQIDTCMRESADGFVELHRIPTDILDNPYLLVFARWSIFHDDDPDGQAHANWVFHIAPE